MRRETCHAGFGSESGRISIPRAFVSLSQILNIYYFAAHVLTEKVAHKNIIFCFTLTVLGVMENVWIIIEMTSTGLD